MRTAEFGVRSERQRRPGTRTRRRLPKRQGLGTWDWGLGKDAALTRRRRASRRLDGPFMCHGSPPTPEVAYHRRIVIDTHLAAA